MRLPLSVHARIAISAVFMSAAIFAVTSNALLEIVEIVVTDNVDVRLDTQLRLLEQAVDGQDRFNSERIAEFPELRQVSPGWGWQVVTSAGSWRSGEQMGQVEFPLPRVHVDEGIYSGRGNSASNHPIRVRQRETVVAGRKRVVTVISPRPLIDRELQRVGSEMRKYFGAILIVLVITIGLQLRVSLRPLRKLSQDIARVRNGDAQTLPERQPPDLQPVAQEVNALIARNNAALEAARLNAANLAHSVKTPLASLLLELEHEGASENALALLQHVSMRVAHHLGRARSAAIGLGSRARCDAAEVVDGVIGSTRLVYRREPISVESTVERGSLVSVDEQDLIEMLGNLVENACRYARSIVRIGSEVAGSDLVLVVEDDGPGIPLQERVNVLRPGVRLDEMAEGYGLGLTMVRELAELYGGSLSLGDARQGSGLLAVLTLPR